MRSSFQVLENFPQEVVEEIKTASLKRKKSIIKDQVPELENWCGKRINQFLIKLEGKIKIPLGCSLIPTRNGTYFCPREKREALCIKLFYQCKEENN